MRGTSAICLIFLVLGLGLAVGISAQEGDGPGHDMPMGPPEEMRQMEHFNGVWDVEFKYKMDPAQDWKTTNGLATFKMILDGGAQQMDYQGEMMGMKFSGIGVTCYDRETNKWQNSWIDNMSSRMSLYEGGPDGEDLVFSGMDMMNGMKVHSRQTWFNVTNDRFEWKMEMSMDGEKYMVTAMGVYTRR